MNRTDRPLLAAALVGALLLGSLWSERFISVGAANRASRAAVARLERVQPRAAPSASTAVDIPMQGSVKDAVGRTYTAFATVHVEIAEPEPIPAPPVGITFGIVTETLGAVTTAKPSGWGLILHGAGFPTTGTLRLQVAGRIAPSSSIVWRPTAIEFTVPPGPPQASAPVTGPFEIFVQENGVWRLLGRGGQFTILPTPVVAAPRR